MVDVIVIGGRWNGHYGQMQHIYGRCYCQSGIDEIATGVVGVLADGLANGQHYSNLSSEMLYRTSSHICGRWYLPMFLFRDGLLTLMYRASLIVLRRF